MRVRLLSVGLLVGALVLPGSAANARPPSQGPSNDTISGATAITALPFNTTEDTTSATTDSDDTALNENCGAPATDASVWYSLAATSEADLLVDVSQSDYSAGVMVASGSPGSLNLETCGPGEVVFHASNGTTYYIVAFDDQFDGGGNGGQLVLGVDAAPPPPEVTLTIDPVGKFNSQGVATVTGTETCTGEGIEYSELDVSLSQNVGRIGTIRGFGFGELICDGAEHHWSVDIFPDSGKFAGGRATASADAFVCNAFTCTDTFVGNQTIRLRR